MSAQQSPGTASQTPEQTSYIRKTSWASIFINLLYPPHCCACDINLPKDMPFCVTCATSLYPIDFACVQCCVPYGQPSTLPCHRCRTAPPPFTRLVSPYRLGGELATAIKKLKYQKRMDIARSLAPLFAPALQQAAINADLVIPIPLHRKRQAQRGFNQATLLLKEAARLLPSFPTIDILSLHRIRNTKSQAQTKSRLDRINNLQGAFAVGKTRRKSVRGKRILLVDDIATTCSTMSEATRTLLQQQATQVRGICLARK